MLERIKEIYKKSRGTYGSPPITAELKAEGIECIKNRVARIMLKNGIIAKTKWKFRLTTRSKNGSKQQAVFLNTLKFFITVSEVIFC